jgi:hypothetical protein
MKKLPIFPRASDDNKWSQYTIDCHESVAPIMEKIIAQVSLVKIDDLQLIAKILHKELSPNKQ